MRHSLLRDSCPARSLLLLLSALLIVVSTAQPCTFFMSTLKGITYFGNNEDFSDEKTNIWFIPAQEGKFGYMYFSYDNGWPQGGMNDQGLCFDGDAVILGGPDKDGDLDIIRKDRDIMVLTNFFPHHPDMGGFPCLRFQSATHHLEQDLQPSVDNFRRIPRFVAYQ
ncbi:MAG: hypothetical protein ACERK6_03715 [Candidatus Aminicenantaceae bacterium]